MVEVAVPTVPSLRTCVGCRDRARRLDLLRVVAVDGALVPDPSRRLGGRGAHLHPDPDCLALAERRRVWPRALRLPGPLVADRLVAYLEQLGTEGTTTAAGDPPAASDTGSRHRDPMSSR